MPPGSDWLVEHFEREVVLFNPRSGSTHLLAEPVYALLEELQQAPASLDGLIDRMRLTEDRQRLVETLRGTLLDLDRLGLIQPLSS